MISFEKITYRYPFASSPAVSGIDLQIAPGEAVLCTGGSGCGKSTMIRLVNGLAPHYYRGTMQGRVLVAGQDNATRPIHAIGREVGTLFQDPEQQFFALNVADELAFALEWRNLPPDLIRERIAENAANFDLSRELEAEVHQLSEGQKQKVAMAGIMALEPRLLILDEPSANLDPEATVELAARLGRLKAAGITLFIVDHRLYWLRDLVDRVVVMDQGRVGLVCDFSELARDGVARSRYGLRQSEVGDSRASIPLLGTRGGEIAISDLTFGYPRRPPLFENFSVRLPRGEVIGLLGANGSGKTTLARLLTGLLPMPQGRVTIDGKPCRGRELLRRSSIVLQNTDHQLHMKSVRDELAASARDLPADQRVEAVTRALTEYRIEHLADRHPQSLSGGEKQRLVIAAAAVRRPDILILDEPTSGLDGANMANMAERIRDFTAQGACVLLISHDLELLERVCTYRLQLGA